MTTTVISPAEVVRPTRSALGWAVADTVTVTWRNLTTLRRLPQMLDLLARCSR